MDTRVGSLADSLAKGLCDLKKLWTTPHRNISVLPEKWKKKIQQKFSLLLSETFYYLIFWQGQTLRRDRASMGRGQKGRAHARRGAGPEMLGMGLVWMLGPRLSPARGQDVGQKNDLFQPCGDVRGKEKRWEHGGESNELKTIQNRHLTNVLKRDFWGHSGNLGIIIFF